MTKISTKLVSRIADSIEFSRAYARKLQIDAQTLSRDLMLKMQRHAQQLANECDRLVNDLDDDAYLDAYELAEREVAKRREISLYFAQKRKRDEQERREMERELNAIEQEMQRV